MGERLKYILPDIRHNLRGFESLVKLYAEFEDCYFENIEIDMSGTSWFDADMCAAFGSVLYRLTENINTIKLTNAQQKVEEILSKNEFLSHYGGNKRIDNWGTTITYRRFNVKDDRSFSDFVKREFVDRDEVPEMSELLRKKFQQSISEIFHNSVTHSKTELGIYCCGQYYPTRKKLDFSIADLGVGIHRVVKDYLGRDISAEEAIIWATADQNTTKLGNVPGGLGLKILSEFIDLNEGKIQIVSDKGYLRRENGKVTTDQLSHPFPGTVVSIEINTADCASYSLASELDAANIF